MINNVEPQLGFVNTYCPNFAEKCDFHGIIEVTIILRDPHRTRIRRTRWDWPFLHSCCVENTPVSSKSLACICRIFVIWFFRSIQLLECKLNKSNVFERFLIRWIFQILTSKLVIPFYWSPPQSGVKFSQIKISVNMWLWIFSKRRISLEKTTETTHKFSEWNLLIKWLKGLWVVGFTVI